MEDQAPNLLLAVNVKLSCLEKDNWGMGWIFDADESFDLFCALKLGWAPIEIEDTEYNQIVSDGVAFFEKNRGRKIHREFHNMLDIR